MAANQPAPGKNWQQTKSARTRDAILDATIDCFYELGYASTTTENVANKAGVSRGAMLHHFPTRFDLIKATVERLNKKRLEMFQTEETTIQKGATYTRVDEGIDAYWKQLNTPVFVVFQELRVAARTDKDLAKVLIPALEDFNRAWYRSVREIFPDLALSEAFPRANYLTQYMLEGMAMSRLLWGPKPPVGKMLAWLKRELHRSYQDVLGKVERSND